MEGSNAELRFQNLGEDRRERDEGVISASPDETPVPNQLRVSARTSAKSLPPDRQLVVARYKEDLSWIAKAELPTIVYCKDPDCGDAGHIHLENTKREAGTYLHHIVSCYDELAELTYFAQGNPFDHALDFLPRCRIKYDRPTSLTTQYLRWHPPQHVREKDLVEMVEGYMVRYGDAIIKAHSGLDFRAWYNPATWTYVFDCPQPSPLWFGYGAMWAVPRECIRQRPLALWKHLLEVCDAGFNNHGNLWTDPPINPWMMEATWYYLFQDREAFPHHRKWDEPGSLLVHATDDSDGETDSLTARTDDGGQNYTS